MPDPGILDTGSEGTAIFYVTQDNNCGSSNYSQVQVDVIDCGVNCDDFEATASAQDTSCPESTDGSIDMTVLVPVPGTNQFSLDGGIHYYDFTSPNNTQTPDTLMAGSYEVLVRALGSGCYPDTTLVNVGSQVIFTTTVDQVEPTCGRNDGRINLSVTGGSGKYTFTLHFPDGSTASNSSGVFAGLRSGVYHYDILDDNSGCTLSMQELILNDSNAITATADPDSFENALCFGEATGRAIIYVTGGTDDTYEYSLDGSNWVEFISGEYIENLPPDGTYVILVRQSVADLCYEQVQVTIENEYPAISFTYTSDPASCELEDGSVSIDTIMGGMAPYEISVNFNPFVTVDLNELPVFTNLAGGYVNIRVQDANGCLYEDDQVFIDFPGYLSADIQSTPPTCAGMGKDGSVSIFIDSGDNSILPPYEFGFASAGTPEDEVILQPIVPDNQVSIDTLTNGSYYVLLHPENGCRSRTDIEVTGGPYAIDFEITEIQDAACKDGAGSIRIENISGDINSPFTIELISMPSLDPVFSQDFPYSYISGGVTLDGNLVSGLTAGEYRVQIRQDQNGCDLVSVSDNFTLSEPDEYLDFEITNIESSLMNLPTGSISILIYPSGHDPYDTRIELNSPLFPGQEISRDWMEVSPSGGNYIFTHEELFSGVYELSIRDQIGCEVTREVTVGYDSALFIPNIFTPNGDRYNDYFEISQLPKSGSGTSLVITNRWGNIIFESDDYNENNLWDGGDYPDGTYFYRLNIPNQGSYSGWVEIWRGN
jgi:gliding motility-associated-like protein